MDPASPLADFSAILHFKRIESQKLLVIGGFQLFVLSPYDWMLHVHSRPKS